MNKTKLAALVIMASAVCANTVSAKKKKAEPAPEQPAATVLTTQDDTLSYALGKQSTEGLIPFIQQQYKVDTVYMADFVQGFKEQLKAGDNPALNARQAGAAIAKMAQERILGSMKKQLEGTPDSVSDAAFYAGFISALEKDSTVFSQALANKYAETHMKSIMEAKKERQAAEGKAWLAENAKKEGVVTLPSGLQYKVITAGTGEKPKATDEVSVKYEGKLIDGTVFDSSYKRQDPVTKFRCNQVIKGWTEALQLMPVGSKWEVYIPYDLGYGERGAGKDIPPFSTLIFTVELVGITK